MSDYQPKRKNPYKLPHNLYMRVLYLIRDYERIRLERQDILFGSSSGDGQPKGNAFFSATESKAIRMACLEDECRAVERAIAHIPQEYRNGVIGNICHKTAFPGDAGYSTYKRWRQRLIYWTARNLNFL